MTPMPAVLARAVVPPASANHDGPAAAAVPASMFRCLVFRLRVIHVPI